MKKKDELYDKLSAKFKNYPELPENLKKENVVLMLKNTQTKKATKVSLKKIGSIAAVFAIVLISAVAISRLNFNNINSPTVAEGNNTTAQSSTAYQTPETIGDLKKAQSREEIEKLILKNYKDAKANGTIYTAGDYSKFDSYRGFSQTNNQTLGIDESDIIKNDGKHLYIVGYDKKENYSLRIVDTETMSVLSNTYFYNDDGDTLKLREIHLKGGKLIAIATIGEDFSCCNYMSNYEPQKTYTIVVNIKDKTKPQILRQTQQDGMYVSSRMSDDILYTVTQYTVIGENDEQTKKNSVPTINGCDFYYDCIYIMEDSAISYICLSAYDTNDSGSEISTLAVLGDATNVYCSKNNLYVIGSKLSEDRNDKISVINSFAFKGSEISFKAQGEVNGYISNQYDLDEYNGTLRIATNSYNRKKAKDLCSLYVLDSELKTIGKLENIADNETVKGVRYMGNKAYIVTFKNTDPLYVIDLKDPSEPKITGEIKLPGYSSYLHPISENIILGIGYDGDEKSADETSIKVSLFDVSDMTSPKVISTFKQDNVYCCVAQDPKAFIYNEEENYIALPVEFYDYNLIGYGCYIISLENNQLTLKHKFNHEVDNVYVDLTFIRGAYIGDSFFTISDDLVYKFSLTDGTKHGEIKAESF